MVYKNCPGLSKIVQDCPGLSKTVQDCPWLSRIVQDCPELSRIVQDRPRLSRIVQDCSGLSIFPAKMHLGVPPAHIMLHLCTFYNLVCKKFFEHPLEFPKILESYIPFIQNWYIFPPIFVISILGLHTLLVRLSMEQLLFWITCNLNIFNLYNY